MKLLLAEDEHELNDVLVTILESYQYTVDAVYDGQSAVEHGLQNNYDGIIMDVMMPKMDGFGALAELRIHGVETPLLILSAKSEVPDRVMGLDLGANDYLPKPFSTDELVARIRAMTRRPSEQPDEFSFGGVTLSKPSSAITCQSASVLLSSKEFNMMEILMKSPGVDISASRFLDEIWKKDENAEANVVWLYASYLQKKIAAVGGSLDIEIMQDEGVVRLESLS